MTSTTIHSAAKVKSPRRTDAAITSCKLEHYRIGKIEGLSDRIDFGKGQRICRREVGLDFWVPHGKPSDGLAKKGSRVLLVNRSMMRAPNVRSFGTILRRNACRTTLSCSCDDAPWPFAMQNSEKISAFWQEKKRAIRIFITGKYIL